MIDALNKYTHWLHGHWPSGKVERLPLVDEQGKTNVEGLYVAGDLSGVPLLKLAADGGARIVQEIWNDDAFQRAREAVSDGEAYDLAIIGCGIAGSAAALEAQRLGMRFVIYEASEPYSTIKNFPKGKPIFTYPSDLKITGSLDIEYSLKEPLVEALDQQLAAAQVRVTEAKIESVERRGGRLLCHRKDAGEATDQALRVLVAIGRSGDFRRLLVPGEELDKVLNRLHDPKVYRSQQVLVVGGGDSGVEAAIALAEAGAGVTLSCRSDALTRPKPENLSRLEARLEESAGRDAQGVLPDGSIELLLESCPQKIQADEVIIEVAGTSKTLKNDVVFSMIGREAPLDFFRRSGVSIRGEWSKKSIAGLVAFFTFCLWIYHWKSYYWFPVESLNPANWIRSLQAHLGEAATEKGSFLYTLLKSASGPSFYYTLLYSSAIGYFGWRRIKRRQTPYVTWQTLSLLAFQWIPLFILPEIILPMMGRNGLFTEGAMLRPVADLFFECYDGGIGEERAYWRAYGFILAWPLMVYNWFTDQPMIGWLVLGGIQTFVLIPLIVYRWGKGAFCGWICSCGALAETLGDTHRHKMPHGPRWTKLNMLGQGVLAFAFIMLGIRIWGWLSPGGWAAIQFNSLLGEGMLSYKWSVDVALAGFLGVGFYFHYSGRVWCRFACPLAALMHIYARFSRFRIFAEKEKCISCNLCTSVCHQGIDIMSFANKGLPMEDPECVRCSACVQSCPTGVLRFGRIAGEGEPIYDQLPASLIQIREARSES